MSNEKFWLEEPCILFTSFAIVPTAGMTKNEKLNALTRLTILITIVLYIIGWAYWLYFLLIMLIIILLLKYVPAGNKEPFTMLSVPLTAPTMLPVNGGCCNTGGCDVQSINISSTGLSSPGTLGVTPYETIVDGSAHMLDEVPHVVPHEVPHEGYIDANTTNVDEILLVNASEDSNEDSNECCYETVPAVNTRCCPPRRTYQYCRPYGQTSYHTRTTLLPSNQAQIDTLNGGSNGAKLIANNLYTANSLKFRAGLELDYQRALNRRNKRCYNYSPTFN